jgi:hypothetical protein
VTAPTSVAIVAKNKLSKIRIVHLRNNSAGLWEICQPIGCIERLLSEDRRDWRRVTRSEQTDRLQIIQSLRRPPYFSHFAIRWRASS